MSPSKKVNRTSRRSKPRGSKAGDRLPKPSARESRTINPRPTPEARRENAQNWRTAVLRVLALLVVAAISLYVFSIRDRVEEFAALGYPGVFLIALLANATVFLPAPGIAVVFAMGSVFHPLGVGLAAGTGGALGELSGYLAGLSGQAVIERAQLYRKVHPWVVKYGPWAILVLSAVPNPAFDLAGVAAGAVKMPIWQFLLFCWAGQLVKMTIFAYSGAYSLTWFSGFIQ